jgi:hypothetical protein
MSALVLPCNPFLGEPPDAIKHVRWCERGRLQSRPLLDSDVTGGYFRTIDLVAVPLSVVKRTT